MKPITIIFVSLLFLGLNNIAAQEKEGVTHSGQRTGQPPFPLKEYKELPNPVSSDLDLWGGDTGLKASWGSTDIRYKKETPMPIKKSQTRIKLSGWRGERVAAQWVVSAYDGPVTLSYQISDLVNTKDERHKITQENIFTGFVRYVMADELNKDGKGACGYRDNADFDSSLVADAIDHLNTTLRIPQHSTRPGWVRVWIPRNAEPGRYKGQVTILGDGKVIETLALVVEVDEHTLPQPHDWSFHLDLWQNPYAVARYYQVPLWSEAHFEAMKEVMKPYAEAGGDVITTSIIHKPWNGQTQDDFETMITWMKKADGTWYFDYTIFDEWVEFMMSMGIDKQINCYTMIPWKLTFQYYDQATNQLRYLKAKPGEAAYQKLWLTMLDSFAKHLKEKGWFDKTYIAMDERPLKDMEAALKVIYKADKNFKVALAGNYHDELADDIDDYCISYGQHFPPEVLQQRKKAEKTSTFYTSCAHPHPNTFTFSPPAESEWMGWYAASQHLDGYLRWAYNSWVLEPLLDSRFTTWAAGDTYFVYPDGRTSIRFERLVAGIQQYEKIQILRSLFKEKGEGRKLKKLDAILDGFEHLDPKQQTAAEHIREAKKALKKLY